MRIALVNGGYPSDRIGGSELQTAFLGEELSRRGHETHYFAVNASTETGVSVIEDRGMTVHRFGGDLSRRRRVGTLAEELRGREIELVYARILPWLPAVVKNAGLAGIPVVANLASHLDLQRLPLAEAVVHPRALAKRMRHNRAVAALALADHVVAQSEDQKAIAQSRGLNRVSVIRNMFPPAPEVSRSRDPQVVWVGSIKPVKAPERFVRLAERLRGTARFVVVGDIQDAACGKVVEGAARGGTIEYAGLREFRETWATIGESWILVNTSLHEGFANTFIQAWSCGTPVCTLGIDPDRILSGEHIGCVASTERELAEQVSKLLQDPVRRAEMGERARGYAERQHSITASCDAYETLFQRLATECSAT